MKALAVIFARGTGDEVPLSSARVLSGKPILHYVIQAAVSSRFVSDVYVSTEDERIATVALAANAKVIRRPENLSQSTTPLTRAVEHAAKYLGKLLEDVGGNLLCLPADAVFCGTSLIDNAFNQYFIGDYDRLVALLPERKKYVIWQASLDKILEPVILQPHLRPQMDSLFSEPGVLTIWKVGSCGEIKESSNKVAYVDIDPMSAFRVDTEAELQAASRVLRPPRLALRCDGSREMGMGHIMRLVNIAERIQESSGSGWDVRFFVGSRHLDGASIVTQRGFDADVIDQDDYSHWIRRIRSFDPSLVINDLPFVPAQYTEDLRALPSPSVTLVDSVQDIEPSNGRLDTVISLLDEELIRPHDKFHHGPAFATIDPSVRMRLEDNVDPQVRDSNLRLIVAFGTGDPAGLTQPTLDALVVADQKWESIIVLVQESQQNKLFWETVERFKCSVEIVNAPSDRLGELLNRSDLALLSGGISTYEASALGVPAIVLCQNTRERKRMEQFERNGSIILLGLGQEVTEAQLTRTLDRVSRDSNLRSNMALAGRQIIDGNGVDRIIKIVQELSLNQRPMKSGLQVL